MPSPRARSRRKTRQFSIDVAQGGALAYCWAPYDRLPIVHAVIRVEDHKPESVPGLMFEYKGVRPGSNRLMFRVSMPMSHRLHHWGYLADRFPEAAANYSQE